MDPQVLQNLPETLKQNAQCTSLSVSDSELGVDQSKVVLLDPAAKEVLKPEDGEKFDYLLFGGILGDHPPKDRTKELRILGYETRHLGAVQLPTDHAVIFSKLIMEDKKQLDDIPHVDFPEVKLAKHESVELPFRYLKGSDGGPMLAPGMKKHIRDSQDEPLL
ncbi:hypothetical protein HK102_007968 [Quaeritorhiza haematococci]|nr:hypothetical protein HK102_007968 [Quaeritorhiza haematococci]